MRKIKFKIWNKKQKIMKYWDLSSHHNVIFLEYTGYKDDDGTEIYEGDIVEYYNDVGVVKLDDGCWIIDFTDHDLLNYEFLCDATSSDLKLKVIGNVFEQSNKHLNKKGEKR